MRSATSDELTLLASAAYQTLMRVWISNGSGTLKNLSSLGGNDYVVSVTIDEDIDQPLMQATVKVLRDYGSSLSLSPLRSDSTLNVDDLSVYAPLLDAGRDLLIETACVAIGATPVSGDWKNVFEGTVDRISFEGPVITMTARDQGRQLADAWMPSPNVSEAAMEIEDVINFILDATPIVAGIEDRPTLYVPTSPGENISPFKWDREPSLDVLVRVVQVIGWDLRYKWDDGTSTWRLTLSDPFRSKTTPDATLGPSQYIDVTQLDIDTAQVRNDIVIVYGSGNEPDRGAYHAVDNTSVTRYGLRSFVDVESSDSEINTSAEATRLGDAILADLKDPKAEQSIEMLYYWPAELRDLYRFSANGVHYDVAQDWAVVSLRHELTATKTRTTVKVRGAPAGYYRLWFGRARNGTGPTSDSTPNPTFPDVADLEVENTSTGGTKEGMIHYRVTFDRNTERVEFYTSEAASSGIPAPSEHDDTSRSAVLRRHEGDIASADTWAGELSVATTTSWYRKMVAVPYSAQGVRGTINITEKQVADSGTGPTGAPTSFSVTMSVVSGRPRAALAWTNADTAAATIIWRNGYILTRVAATVASLHDDGLSGDLEYNYKVQHIRNGQTSAFAEDSDTSSTPTLTTPTLVSVAGWVQPGVGTDDGVAIRVSNPDALAETRIYMGASGLDSSFAEITSIPPGQTDYVLHNSESGAANGQTRYFYVTSFRTGYAETAASSHLHCTVGP